MSGLRSCATANTPLPDEIDAARGGHSEACPSSSHPRRHAVKRHAFAHSTRDLQSIEIRWARPVAQNLDQRLPSQDGSPPTGNRFDVIQCQPANFRQCPLVMPSHNSEAIGGTGHISDIANPAFVTRGILRKPEVKGPFDQF
jgi:hypothetical protein